MAYKVDKQHRPIWNSEVDIFDQEALNEARETFIEDGYAPDEITEEMLHDRLYEWNGFNLEAERTNLDIETGGFIIAYCDLGFWDGRRTGLMKIGSNVSDIFNSNYSCDYHDFYVDPYNVRYTGHHHDSSHRLLFRMVADEDAAQRIMDKFVADGYELDEADFRKKTKSIRKFVAKVYGW